MPKKLSKTAGKAARKKSIGRSVVEGFTGAFKDAAKTGWQVGRAVGVFPRGPGGGASQAVRSSWLEQQRKRQKK